MDPFADRMTARGPTLAADRETWTGSLHIVDLPGADAAREFVEREPYNRAGMFESHLIYRFGGVVLAIQTPESTPPDALLGDWRAGLDERLDVEIHDWEFGGRR